MNLDEQNKVLWHWIITWTNSSDPVVQEFDA
jgi:hypothetical protein